MPDLTLLSFDPPDGSATDLTPTSISGSVIVGTYMNAQGQDVSFEDNSGVVSILAYPNAVSTVAGAVNASGVVIGSYTDSSNITHGFEYSGQAYTSIDFPGVTQLAVSGINDSGVVVGSYLSQADGNAYGFTYQNGVITQLTYGAVAGQTGLGITSAFINASGQIAGSYNTQSGTNLVSDGYIYSNGNYTSFSAPNFSSLQVAGITSAGAVYGFEVISTRLSYETEGFVFQNGALSIISPPGAMETYVTGISTSGEIVGYYADFAGVTHGFIDLNGVITTVDAPLSFNGSEALGTRIDGISNTGVIDGVYESALDLKYHGFVIPNQSAPSDFNADGISDILWRNTNGQVAIWLSTPGGGFTYPTTSVADMNWSVQAVGDFNGDGKADILWRNTNGDAVEWQANSGPGYARPDLGFVDTSWQIDGVGDFNGDAKSDILWRNVSGQVSLWLSNAGAGYMGYTTPVIAQVDPSWTVAGVGDFNGDGKADILWRNANGDVAEWLSNTGAGYTGFTAIDLGVVPTSWTIQGVGDFNGDGKADILWRNTNGQISLWLSNSGAGVATYATPVIATVDPVWAVQAVGDYNGDGKADVLWRDTTGDVAQWLSTSGAGYTGFTGPVIATIATSWSIVGGTPPALAGTAAAGAARLSQAMAAMAASEPAIVSTTPPQPTLAPIIAAPATV